MTSALPRGIAAAVAAAWSSNPVVVLEGARAVGKTTLARSLVPPDRYVNLTDPGQRAVARADTLGWLESLPSGVVIDEAQTVPQLSLEIKRLVDNDSRPGRFLLTGSARFSRAELGGSDPLVGRVRRLHLEPFAQCELEGAPRDVITALFEHDPREWHVQTTTHEVIRDRFGAGGFPLLRSQPTRTRYDAADNYVSDLFSGDIYETARHR
jgi:uncharacterized protein